jgi:hypothetical protein
MNILIDMIFKSSSKIFVDTIAKLLSLFLTERMIAIFILDLLDVLAKRTKNTLDDKAVSLWKEQAKKAGIIL